MRFTPKPVQPGGLGQLPVPVPPPLSPELRRASCRRERLNCCTLPSANPTLPCLECMVSNQPTPPPLPKLVPSEIEKPGRNVFGAVTNPYWGVVLAASAPRL